MALLVWKSASTAPHLNEQAAEEAGAHVEWQSQFIQRRSTQGEITERDLTREQPDRQVRLIEPVNVLTKVLGEHALEHALKHGDEIA